jgi:hypothetical protein
MLFELESKKRFLITVSTIEKFDETTLIDNEIDFTKRLHFLSLFYTESYFWLYFLPKNKIPTLFQTVSFLQNVLYSPSIFMRNWFMNTVDSEYFIVLAE